MNDSLDDIFAGLDKNSQDYFDNLERVVESLRSTPIEKIKEIRPQWACGLNENFLMDASLHSVFDAYSIYMVDLIDFIKITDMNGLNTEILFDNDADSIASDSRIATTLQVWHQGGFIDPPIVSILSGYKGLKIADGRHRTIAAYHIGEKEIPIAIHKTLVKDVGNLITLKPILEV